MDTSRVLQRSQLDLLLLVCGLLLALLVSILLSRGFFEAAARRLNLLGEAAQRLAGGDLEARVHGAGSDEIGRLAGNFNTMAASIQTANERLTAAYEELRSSRVEVERYAQMLEEMVADRTHELREAMEAAQSASRAKSEFLANVSHEIRTPLNGLIGLADLLAVSHLDERQAERVQGILRSAETLLALINDILDFARIESGRMVLDLAPFPPAEPARLAVAMLSGRAQARGLTLNLHVNGAEPPWVVGDERRVQQVLLNLLGNAIKFTERGSIDVTVHVAPAPDGSALQAVYTVRDTGIGIPADKLDVIFDSFTQVDGSSARRFGGTGLGLAISQQLSELMGGRIAVESAEGRGSLFTLSLLLPAAREDDAALAA